MLSNTPTIDAARWARLKEHLADLTALDAAERVGALAALPLDDVDRDWLQRLLAPLLAKDPRLLEPHAAVIAVADGNRLRYAVGDRIGRYRIEGLLGLGGMGEVYAARALDDEQPVALKVLRSGLAQSDYARFSENEQRALRRLDDPRIAKFIEAFVAPDVGSCLVLEWVDGEPLQTYCQGRRFGVEARLKLFIDVCHAVASAHQQLIVHRDLKPGNVLVTPEGQVKLLDFGVAKLLDEVSTHTQTHGDLFTLDYAAPEQVLHEPASTATDIYALGVLLYRLLTDASPYARHDGGSLVKAVLNEAPQPLAEAIQRTRAAGHTPPAPALDRDLDRVVGHAMEKDPRHRYGSALELAADVQAVLDGRPILSGGGGWYRVKKFTRRHRTAVAAVSVVVLALLVATGFSLRAARSAELQAHRAEVANRFLLTALDLTDRFSGNNRGDLSLAEVLERAVAQAHTQLWDEPEVRAEVLVQLSTALQHRGKAAAALAAAREAYSIRAAERDGAPIHLAITAQQLASVEIDTGALDQATQHLQVSLQQLARAGPQDRERISAYTSLGKLASMRGDAVASLRWYQQILPLRQSLRGDNDADLGMDYNNLGTGLYNLSRYREADVAYAHGIELLRRKLGDQHPRTGFVLFSRARTLIQLGRFAEARTLLTQAEAVFKASGSASGSLPGSINPESARAQLDGFASDYASALRRLQTVLPQAQHASPVSVAALLSLRGRIELASGDADAASRSLSEAYRLYADNGRAEHAQCWFARGLAGVAVAAQGEIAVGNAELNTALAQFLAKGVAASSEQAELLLYSGAAARRRGDLATALRQHGRAAVMQRQIGWLGELGLARVNVELAQDALADSADAKTVVAARRQLGQSIEVMQRIGPHDPQLVPLLALQAVTALR